MVKKRDHPKIEELIERPWCYYCERDFDDARVLLSHQKAKHFRCNHCNRRLNTAGGLSVHLQQVHKMTLTSVENAIEGREGVDPEIFGMCGVPEDLINAHKQRIMNEYFKMEAERRARTGNPPPGTATGEPKAKKAKIETPEELKERLKAHRAKRAAEKANATQTNATTTATSPGAPVPGSISPATTPNNGANMYSAPANMPVQPPQFPSSQFPPSQFPPPHSSLPQSPSNYGFSQPAQGFPPPFLPQHPGHWPQSMPMPMPSFSPSQGPPFAGPPMFPPGMPQGLPPMPGQMPGSTVARQPTRYSQSPVAPTPSTLPPAPGLPARPTAEAPNYTREEMSRMHAGHPTTAGHSMPKKPVKKSQRESAEVEAAAAKASSEARDTAELKEFIQSAEDRARAAPTASATPAEATTSVKKKKSTKLPQKLVYTDDSESPEEKLAKRQKYAFKRDNASQFVLGEVGAAVTGVAVGEDDVRDVQD